MNFNLLLVLALTLSGYWFLTRTYQTRYWITRQSGYHLFFTSAIMGVVLFTFARLITSGFGGFCEPCTSWTRDFAPFDYSGTVIIGAVLALGLPRLINRFSSKDRAAKRRLSSVETLPSF